MLSYNYHIISLDCISYFVYHCNFIHHSTTKIMPYATTNIKGVDFKVPDHYKIQKFLGQGAYGIVVEAIDSRSNTHVAIKKLEKVFNHLEDAKRILRELSLLRYLAHENVTQMLDIVVP